MAILETCGVSFSYEPGCSPLWNNLTLAFPRGTFTALLGPNGAGKSTLLRLLAGLLKPTQGEVRLEGVSLAARGEKDIARRMAYVPQRVHFAFPLSAGECVSMGRFAHQGFLGRPNVGDRKACDKALRWCDVEVLADRAMDSLSGGERQRVLLASALAQEPSVLLLDEPTGSLDLAHQESFFSVVRKMNREEGLTVIVATHELNLAARFADRLVLLREGKIYQDGPPQKVLTPGHVKTAFQATVRRLRSPDGSFHLVPVPRRGEMI